MMDQIREQVPIDLLLDAVFHRWPLIAALAFLLPALAVPASKVLPKNYRASAQVYVEDSVAVNPFMEDMKVEWTVKRRLPVIKAVLKSRAIMDKVLMEMGEIDEHTPPREADERARILKRQISVFGMGGGMVSVKVNGKDPDRVHRILSLLVDAFVTEMLRPQKEGMEETTVFLEDQLDRVRNNLSDIEGDMQAFKEAHADELPDVYKVNLDAYLQTQKQLLTARSDLQAKRREVGLAKKRIQIFDPVSRELESDLAQAQASLARLKAAYTDRHPDVLAAQARVRDLRRRRKEYSASRSQAPRAETLANPGVKLTQVAGKKPAVESSTDDLMTADVLALRLASSEAAGLESSIQELEGRSDDMMQSVRSFARHERTLNGFQRDLDVKLKVYQDLLQKYEDARVTKELAIQDEKNQVWVIEAPRRPTTPTTPGLAIVGLGSVFGGAILGLVLALLREFLTRHIRTEKELIEAAGEALILISLPDAPHEVRRS